MASAIGGDSPWRAAWRARYQARWRGTPDLPGPVVVMLAGVLAGVGVLVDLRGEPTLGAGTGVAVLLAAFAAPVVVQRRALTTAIVLPPLLVAAAAAALAGLSGRNRGARELVLDAGTTLALSAPLVFGATAACLTVAVLRIVVHLLARRRRNTGGAEEPAGRVPASEGA